MSFSLWVVIAEGAFKANPAGNVKPPAGKCAFCNARADVGARVALLQSPILPAARSL